jgi:hypothetical protein
MRCDVCLESHDLPAAAMIQHLRSFSSDALLRHAISKMVRGVQAPSAVSAQLTSLPQQQRGTKRGREPEAIDEQKSSGPDASPAPAASSSSSLSFNPTLNLGLTSTLHTSAAAASTSDAMDESVDFDPAAVAASSSAVPAAAAAAASSSATGTSPVVSSAGASHPSESLASSLDLFRSSLVVGSLVDVRVSGVDDEDRFAVGEVTEIDFANARVTVLIGGQSKKTRQKRCACGSMFCADVLT